MTTLLIVPGLGGSGEAHWQSRFEALYRGARRVGQANWSAPEFEPWCQSLADAVRATDGPIVLVAHSLGCILTARWSLRGDTSRIVGALLVAPADAERSDAPAEIRGFAPIPMSPLPFPCTVVYSRNDPFASAHRAQQWAAAWDATAVDVGALGHINVDSDLGTWPQGQRLLEALLQRAPFALDPLLAADTIAVGESELCLLRLLDDARYPWLVLIPKRAGLSEPFELGAREQQALWAESALVSQVLRDALLADKVNVGALGNVVRQLHLHHVARSLGDPAWPGPVWGHSPRVPYSPPARAAMLARLAGTALARDFRLA